MCFSFRARQNEHGAASTNSTVRLTIRLHESSKERWHEEAGLKSDQLKMIPASRIQPLIIRACTRMTLQSPLGAIQQRKSEKEPKRRT